MKPAISMSERLRQMREANAKGKSEGAEAQEGPLTCRSI
jgi:hypothetical protein